MSFDYAVGPAPQPVILTEHTRNVDWRWRELFNVIALSLSLRNVNEVKWRTSCLLRAKLHTDRRHAL